MNIPPRLHWFAVRVTYGRELALKAFLDEEKIENFIPMRRDYVVKDGRRICKFVPAVHNLVFIRSTRKRIDTLKDKAGMNIPIRYIMNRSIIFLLSFQTIRCVVSFLLLVPTKNRLFM